MPFNLKSILARLVRREEFRRLDDEIVSRGSRIRDIFAPTDLETIQLVIRQGQFAISDINTGQDIASVSLALSAAIFDEIREINSGALLDRIDIIHSGGTLQVGEIANISRVDQLTGLVHFHFVIGGIDTGQELDLVTLSLAEDDTFFDISGIRNSAILDSFNTILAGGEFAGIGEIFNQSDLEHPNLILTGGDFSFIAKLANKSLLDTLELVHSGGALELKDIANIAQIDRFTGVLRFNFENLEDIYSVQRTDRITLSPKHLAFSDAFSSAFN